MSPRRLVLCLWTLFGVAVCVGAQSWTNIQGTVWSRSGARSISCQKQPGARYVLTSTGTKDWALNGMPTVAVEPGEEFILSCATKKLPGVTCGAPCQPCLVTRNRANEVVDWYFLGEDVKPGASYEKRFIVPPNVFSLYARVAGSGAYAGEVGPLVLTRTGRHPIPAKLDPVRLESEALAVTLTPSNGAFTVTDRRTGRVWTTDASAKGVGLPATFRCVSAYRKDPGEAMLLYGESDLSVEPSRIRFELEGSALTVTLDFPHDMPLPRGLRYPAPFTTKKGDRLIVARNEGMGYPVDEEHLALRSMSYACGYVLSMPFFGVVDDQAGAGFIAISETHEDGMLETYRLGLERLWAAGPGWMSEFGRFGYARRVRYEFSPKGGPVALAKMFRAWAKRKGWVKTFAEKALARPHVTRLYGAPNMWPFMPDRDKLAHAKELQALGVDRFLWSAGGDAAAVSYLAGQKDILVGRYDNVQDVFHPRLMERMGKPGVKGKWQESFPQDCMWTGETSNSWRRAWGIEIKEGTNVVMEHCATLCDARAVFYERDYAAEELKTKPYNARFMDTSFSEAWKECRAPAHPMNRRESRLWRLQMMRTLQDEFGLVTGSERGSASTVPVCDYYEGMMSISGSGVPRAGRDMAVTWTNDLPEACAKYAVNPVYRLPLWELVFHDCASAYWYWGDGNLKIPGQWSKRDLFNVLYGTAPLFLYTKEQWPKFREGIVRSYKRVCPVVRACGGSEMVDHQILTPDRQVQRTVFANGVIVTVNFSESPWTDEKGKVVPPGDFVWRR
ncbi:MAG: glycoside hydrolase [bacterium]|nr:glycoside hydrolase [bacterium]